MITVDLRGEVPPDWAPSYVQRSLAVIRRTVAVVGSSAPWGQIPNLLLVLSTAPERNVTDDPGASWWNWLRPPRAEEEDDPVEPPVLKVLDGRAGNALTGLIADAEEHAPRSEAGVHVIGVSLVLDRSVPAGDRAAPGESWGDNTDTRRDRREAWALYASGAMLRLCLEQDPHRATADYWAPEDSAGRPTGPLLTQLTKLLDLYRWPRGAANVSPFPA
jgi:hypothetical protein